MSHVLGRAPAWRDLDLVASTRRVTAGLESLEVERVAFSAADVLGRCQVAKAMRQAGLLVEIDSALNVTGTLRGSPSKAPLLIGSHLDTVPNPGRFDGALGVFVAIECASALRAPASLKHPLMVVGFSDEEGTTTSGCWGSRALTGQLSSDDRSLLTNPSSHLSQALGIAKKHFASQGWDVDRLSAGSCEIFQPAGYLELHIEQGPVLDRSQTPTGCVTSIVGIRRYEVSFVGKSGHAGTVPMEDRNADAVVRMAEAVERYWREILRHKGQAVVNFGMVEVNPGSYNVIPEEVKLAVEIRSPDLGLLNSLESKLEDLTRTLSAEIVSTGASIPVELNSQVRRAVLDAADEASIRCSEMPSWAGHDAAVLSRVAPSGMIFVPSVGGESHCPQERTEEKDITTGLQLFIASVCSLDAILP